MVVDIHGDIIEWYVFRVRKLLVVIMALKKNYDGGVGGREREVAMWSRGG